MQKIGYKYKNIDGVKIAYRDLGKGKLVFCLPGWPVASSMYLPLSYYLVDSYRLILPDIPGWAGKSDSVQGEGTLEKLTDLMYKFIVSFEIKEYSIIGYSYGGILTQCLITKGLVPQKTVLVSTLSSSKEPLNDPEIREIVELQQERQMNKYWNLFLIITTMAHVSHSLHLTKLQKMKSLIMFDFIRSFMFIDVEDTLFSVVSLKGKDWLPKSFDETEVLAIYGENEQKFMQEGTKKIAKRAHIKPYIIPKGTHKHLIYQPELSGTIIKKFLSK